jgi:hypothetical protein
MMFRTKRLPISIFLITILVFLPLTLLKAQNNLLGEVKFPTSGAGVAQESFIEGLLFLHNFEYRDAAISFREAQDKDPEFMMAYWGEAMTKNQPIWFRQQREEAVDILNRLAPSPDERQQMGATQREKDYLHTLEILFGTTPGTENLTKEERDIAYMNEMKSLHETYPEDHEARSFYGLSMLGTAHDGRDFRLYMRAAAVLMPVWDENRKHPGAAHYLIHSFDDPVHAPLGLPMAEVYSEIAPSAAHAQHMTSHIFVAMGMWDRVVHANEVASEVEISREKELGEKTTVCGHNRYWLVYGYTQTDQLRDAAEIIDTCYERVSEEKTGSNLWHFAMMKARYVIDSKNWDAADQWEINYDSETSGSAGYHFTKAYAAVQENKMSDAADHIQLLQKIQDENPSDELEIMTMELNGLSAFRSGDKKRGVELLQEAAEMESGLPLDYGPPTILKPTHELLGEIYLEMEEFEKAAEQFHRQLDLTPKRKAAQIGLAKTSDKLDDQTVQSLK